MDIDSWLHFATNALTQAGIPSARLDALLLVSDELKKDKAWALAHPYHSLTDEQRAELQAKLARRAKREPLAYIRSRQEFYGRDFMVSPAVLIPRPETEMLIEQLRRLEPKAGGRLIDVGTGCGAIAVTTKLELPELSVWANDISEGALAVARGNAERLGAQVTFTRRDLLAGDRHRYDFIVANLPYVSRLWERSPETDHEPELALFAEEEGLALIKKLIAQATARLAADGYVIVEADPEQHASLINFARECNFELITNEDYVVVFRLKI